MSQFNIKIITKEEDGWPDLLPEHPKIPNSLWLQGKRQPGPALAIIGTREPSTKGQELARRVARHFAAQGVSIISGLALGCDSAAHEGALEVGGHTVGVIGHGHQYLYPSARANNHLQQRILEAGGAILSIVPPSTPITRAGFVRRDFLQAALSSAVFLTQSGEAGGSWHAIRAAAQLKRTVAFACLTQNHPKDAGPLALHRALEGDIQQATNIIGPTLPPLLELHSSQDYPTLMNLLKKATV